ncbi:hypothetical protein ACMHYO_16470 [Allopusillimonas ginsengisoli]|uniref:hypothetical protein n=1 Tax=Allopusillimonas ginsengisoli TaxID=453575 RepID=UPI0010C1FCE4|nr:hypothetical protein D7I39_11200 [Allopusillimonas ginsengisoli]
MKTWIFLLSLLAVALSWRLSTRTRHDGQLTLAQKIKILGKSLMAGVVVYFTLIGLALLYLMLTN